MEEDKGASPLHGHWAEPKAGGGEEEEEEEGAKDKREKAPLLGMNGVGQIT
jgi:hypothetical protein